MLIVVTGGAGYLGSVLCAKLLAAGYSVRVLDSLLYGGAPLLSVIGHHGFRLCQKDIRNADLNDLLGGADAVVHLAAVVGDPACARDPRRAAEVNLRASLRLIEAAARQGVKRFIFASTCSNYGRMAALGSTDPAGIAYVPGMGMFISDSEVEESPFFRTTNLWKLQPDGTLIKSYSLLNFTNEPTGLAFDSGTNRLYISDDDLFKIFWVDPANPTVLRGQSADTRLVYIVDPEDVAVNPNNGHLFIANGTGNSLNGGPFGGAIVETNTAVDQVFSVIRLPAEIKDPEALAYDAAHDVFYVGGGFGPNVWVVDRSGTVLQVIDVLAGYRHAQ